MRVRGRGRQFRVGRGGPRPPQPLSFWPKPKQRWSRYYGLWALAVGGGLVLGVAIPKIDVRSLATPQPLIGSQGERVTFTFCHTGGGINCVVDGDTIWFHGENIRIVGIDTPETHDFTCPAEKALGDQATQRLLQLVNSGTVTTATTDRDEDRYGRKLRFVFVDGVSVADRLVGEGLAHPYDGGPKQSWC